MADKFCVFILSHNRADRVHTYRTLIKQGYTGAVYIVIDDEDPSGPKYHRRYGDKVLEFSKNDIAQKIDEGSNFGDRRVILYARNACFDLAEQLGFKYFLQLDDDYRAFRYVFNNNYEFVEIPIKDLDAIFKAMLTFYRKTPAVSLCMSQNGDFIGGAYGANASAIKLRRKAMNSFFCSTDRRFQFMGAINEDVNTYTNKGRQGELYLSLNQVGLTQAPTQSNRGGMTEIYLDSGTYLKSFYSVMYSPSCVKVSVMGAKAKRLHHRVRWDNTAPMILREGNQ